LLYLALRNISKKWTIPSRNWKQALNHFVIMFNDRIEAVKWKCHLHKIFYTPNFRPSK